MMINSIRYFGMNDFDQFERMTLNEYFIRMKAKMLINLDRIEELHEQAWLNWQVQSTKKHGKAEVPVYQSFDKFFNKKKMEQEILGIKDKEVDSNLLKLMKKANSK